MIKLYNNTDREFNELIEIINYNQANYFYLTENNQRFIIDNSSILKKIIKQSNNVFFTNDLSIDRVGMLLIWKGISDDSVRNYLKFSVNNEDTLKALLTILFWTYGNELYIKLPKNSQYLRTFYSKGFKFNSGRGDSVLLKRDKRLIPKLPVRDKDDSNLQYNSR